MNNPLRKAQEQILQAVAASDSKVYLVGGTALAMRFRHRYSEDLDFFTKRWTKALYRALAKRITAATGQELTGGRQGAKDMFDLWYLSTHHAPLHEWFPAHFGREDYARLARWLQAMTRQDTAFALLDVAPGCDTKRVLRHLEEQVYERLNRVYVSR